MNKTQIEWTLNPDGTLGYTWNPITGCLNGCTYCYARRLANTRLKERYLNNFQMACAPLSGEWFKACKDPFHTRFWPNRLQQSLGKPKGIFVCDMSDLFGIGVPEEWTAKVLKKISLPWYKDHRFYLLTKQPQNLIKFSPFPDNCWVGVSATDDVMFTDAWRELKEIDAKIKYVSFEPLLKWDMNVADIVWTLETAGISWVILGGMPKIEWVKEIVDACDKAGIPVFLKDSLTPLFAHNDCVGFQNNKQLFKVVDNFPTRYHLRQEFPREV